MPIVPSHIHIDEVKEQQLEEVKIIKHLKLFVQPDHKFPIWSVF